MTISLNCECGSTFTVPDSKAGRAVACTNCGRSIVIPKPTSSDLETEAYQLAPNSPDNEPDDVPVARPKRRRKRSSTSTREGSSTDVEKSETKSPRIKQLLIAAACFVAVLCLIAVFVPDAFMKLLIFAVAVSPIYWFAVSHWCYRHQIADEIEDIGGTLNGINWLPFQGMLFTKGWLRRRSMRFYRVNYTDRNGNRKESLCGISPVCLLWDDEIDSWSFQISIGQWQLRLLLVTIVPAIAVPTALTAYTELRYSIWGQVAEAAVIKTDHQEVRRRRNQIDHRYYITYQYKDLDGTLRTNKVRTTQILAVNAGQSVKIEFISGTGSSRLYGVSSWMWIIIGMSAGGMVLIVWGLDYFDVFGLHSKQKKSQRETS